MRIVLKIFLRNTQYPPTLKLWRAGAIRNTKKGFTLVELLVSITIFALAGVAVYTVLANGITVWRRGSKDRTYLRKVRLTTESMARDLRNTFKFSGIVFEGGEDFIVFPALILKKPDSTLDENEDCYKVGRVAYFYNKKRKALCKERKSLSEVYQQEGEIGKGKVLFEQLRKLEFSYCYLDNATGNYKWKDEWKKEEQDTIPVAIKLKMVFKKEIDREDFEKTIFIPIGTGEQRIELGSIIKQVETK